MITKDDAETALENHDSQKSAAESLGVSVRTMLRVLREGREVEVRKPKEAPQVGRSLTDFRAEYDKDYIIPCKIKAALEQLGDGWDYEVSFARMAGVSLTDLGNYREQFADHYLSIRRDGKRAWSGSVTTILQMKEMI